MQDILIRYKRMQGYEALWQPGTDHAAIATEVKVINKLKKEGVDKADLGRDGFLKECWKWRDEYGTRIVRQPHKLGSSADWGQGTALPRDQGCSRRGPGGLCQDCMRKAASIKGPRIINWCPVCQTSISDAEVEHVEQNGSLFP
ncbi:MAG: class I tRNA ligase family protein [Enterocloster clostridioformis]